jgi:hypothetical protein
VNSAQCQGKTKNPIWGHGFEIGFLSKTRFEKPDLGTLATLA